MAATPFRLLEEGQGSPAWNMAVDEMLLEAVAANAAPPTLRLYNWDRRAISVGRFQNIARSLDLAALEANTVPVVRRITGGRGILHGADLTISVIAPVEALGFAASENPGVIAIYERLAEGFLTAFREMGINAVRGVCQRKAMANQSGDCFTTASRADIIDKVSGQKLLGTALHRRDRWILQQTSFPIPSAPLFQHHDSLSKALFKGCENTFCRTEEILPQEAQVRTAIREGMQASLGLSFSSEELLQNERERASALEQQRYLTESWTYLRS